MQSNTNLKYTHTQFLLINTKVRFTLDAIELLASISLSCASNKNTSKNAAQNVDISPRLSMV